VGSESRTPRWSDRSRRPPIERITEGGESVWMMMRRTTTHNNIIGADEKEEEKT
jgi:hypothetical protein